MKKNVGKTDKMIRIVLGIIFLILGYTVSPWFYLFAVIDLITAFTGFCLLYSLFGINTCKTKESNSENAVYKCEGTCGGEAHEAKNCGDSTCTHFGKPLVKQ